MSSHAMMVSVWTPKQDAMIYLNVLMIVMNKIVNQYWSIRTVTEMLCPIFELAYINLHNGVNQIIVSSSVLRRSCETFSTKKLYFLCFRYSYTKKIKWCIDVLYCTDCNGYIMYQFDCDGELVIVTQEPVSDFSGM